VTDALSAATAALFGALEGAIGMAVFQHVPQDHDPAVPVTVIADITSSGTLSKGADDDVRLTVTIYTIVQGRQNRPVTVAQGLIVAALDGKALAQDGWMIAPSLTRRECRLMEDGITYLGTTLFSALALSD